MSPPRNDIETTTTCPICHVGFAAVRRQLYCTPACRQAAWRARATSNDLNTVSTPVLPARGRREHTVYACTECDQRYLGEQWCYDCIRPCIRVGLGGSCPSCDEPVVLDELLNLHNDDLTAKSRENPASTKPGAVQNTLTAAYHTHRERFGRRPHPPLMPTQFWINQPELEPQMN